MVKKIIIESQWKTDPKFNDWAAEAVREFTELFPEFRDKFVIEDRKCHKPRGSVISEEKFNNLPDDAEKKLYVRLKNGRYLVPYQSTDWYVQQARLATNGRELDASVLSGLRLRHAQETNSTDIVIMLANSKFKPFCFGYGLEGYTSSISTSACRDKDFFKNIIKHELGHVFRATYAERSNIVEALGEHCTNPDCIMEKYTPDFTKHLNRPIEKPFCDECLESMREYMGSLPELKKTVSLTNDNASLPPAEEKKDDAWKKPLRDHFSAAVAKDGSHYAENTEAKNYQAQLRETDGTVTNIEASSPKHIAMSAVNKNGQVITPDLKKFRDIVQYARKNKMAIELGSIKTAEYRARLVLACLTETPPMEITNMPPLDDAFFDGVSPDIKAQILAQRQKPSPEKTAGFPDLPRGGGRS